MQMAAWALEQLTSITIIKSIPIPIELSDVTFLFKINIDTQVISTKVNISNIRYTLKYLSMQQLVIYAC